MTAKPEKPKLKYPYTRSEQTRIISRVMRYGLPGKVVSWKLYSDRDTHTINLELYATNPYGLSVITIRTIEKLFSCSLSSIDVRKPDYDMYVQGEADYHIEITFRQNRPDSMSEINRTVSREVNRFDEKLHER